MNKKIFLTSLILTITFAVNAQSWFDGSKKIKGNGNIITETRTTSSYNSIAVGGSFDVILVKEKEGKITIEGEENIISYIETTVSRNTLKIAYKENTNIRTTKKLTVTVPFESINSVSLGGSGTIFSEDLIKTNNFKASIGGSGAIEVKIDVNSVKAAIGGSGNIYLEGSSNELNCSIAGSGNVNAYNLTTKEVNASIAGSGDVKTKVTSKINAKIVGSGSVYYKGNPNDIDTTSVGSGDVIDKN